MNSEGTSATSIARAIGVHVSTGTCWCERAARHLERSAEEQLVVADPTQVQIAELRVGGSGKASRAWARSAIEDWSRAWLASAVDAAYWTQPVADALAILRAYDMLRRVSPVERRLKHVVPDLTQPRRWAPLGAS